MTGQACAQTSVISLSADDTKEVAIELATYLQRGDVVTLEGPLGAGKTTFTKGLISALTAASEEEIASPTFTYLSIYDGNVPVHHFDAYRIDAEEIFAQMGLAEYINPNVIAIIEWPSKIPSFTKNASVHVKIDYQGQETREIEITYYRI